MPRPIVEIHQELLNSVVVPADPTQKACVVGPAYVVRRYPEDKGSSPDHVYDPFPLTAALGNNLATVVGDSSVEDSIADYPGQPATAVAPELTGSYAPKVHAENVYFHHAEVAGCDLTDAHATAEAGRTIATRPAGDWTSVANLADASTPQLRARIFAASTLESVLTVDASAGVDFKALGVHAGYVVRVAAAVNAQRVADGGLVAGGAAYVDEVVDLPILRVESNRLFLADKAWAAHQIAGADVTPTDGPLNGTGLTATNVASDAAAKASTSLAAKVFNVVPAGDAAGNPNSVLTATITDAGGVATAYSMVSVAAIKSQVWAILSNGLDADGAQPALNISLGVTPHFRTTTLHKAHVRLEGKWTGGAIELVSGTDFNAKSDEIVLGQNSSEVSAAMSTTLGKIVSADIYVAWRGLNTGLTPEIGSLSSTANIPATLGVVDPRNPLALAMHVALSNSGGVRVSYLPIGSDDAAGYVAALNTLNSDPEVYAIAPLSSDLSGVLLPYKNAAVAMSAPKKGKFRIIIGSTEEVPQYKFCAYSPTAPGEGGQVVGVVFTDADGDANFVSSGVAAGDQVVSTVTNAGVVTETVQGTVVSVEGENSLKLSNVVGQDAFNLAYYIRRNIASVPDARATALVDTLSGSNDKRLMVTYPAECTVLGYSDRLPGYYLSAAVAGMMSVLPPHRPLNQIGLASVTGLYDSNFTFSEDQIDVISDGGYFVFVQDSPQGAPYCVHQLTSAAATMPGVQEYSEVSVVRNFDYVSAFLKKRLDPYVGVWNVIPSAVNSIKSTLDSGILDLTSRSADIIGAPLLSGQVDFIRQSAADAGTLEGSVTVRLPKVLNKLVIHLVSA